MPAYHCIDLIKEKIKSEAILECKEDVKEKENSREKLEMSAYLVLILYTHPTIVYVNIIMKQQLRHPLEKRVFSNSRKM
jgi:hypothetical protein